MVRRLLPITVAGALALAALRLAGQEAGLYGTEVGIWLMASGVIALLVPLVWRVGWFLERSDAERRALGEELRALAERDPLTGLVNRRRLDEELRRQLAYVRRYGGSFALLAIDLDHFKLVNDRFGHAAGDRVLVEIARRLEHSLRTTDVLARIGGDEFVALLPAADIEAAEAVAEKLVSRVDDGVRVSGTDAGITASVGAVVCDPPSALNFDPDALLVRADRLLYRAKGSGRNAFIARPAEAGDSVIWSTDALPHARAP